MLRNEYINSNNIAHVLQTSFPSAVILHNYNPNHYIIKVKINDFINENVKILNLSQTLIDNIDNISDNIIIEDLNISSTKIKIINKLPLVLLQENNLFRFSIDSFAKLVGSIKDS